ncbi:MAG: PKD domain-containing protein [Candidatus Bipolaricaulaceae bacterium]
MKAKRALLGGAVALVLAGFLAGCNLKARFTAYPSSGKAPLTVVFDASSSTVEFARIVSYEWDFGDGTKGRGVRVYHTYTKPGAYRVKLTVTASDGEVSTAELIVVVTENVGNNKMPAWSPDGRWIAFVSDRDENEELYLISADGKELVRLTNNAAVDTEPAWTPGGDKLLFVSNRDGQKECDIYVFNMKNKEITRLTYRPDVWDANPSWTPSARKEIGTSYMVFASNMDGNQEIYLFNLSDFSWTRLTYSNNPSYQPSISPDGTKVAFTRAVSPENTEIFVVDIQTKSIRQLTFSKGQDITPRWSPDGTKISFATNRDGNWEIYTMNVDGSGLKNLTNNDKSDDQWPSWSPDGQYIVFQSNRTGRFELFIMFAADGTGQKQLTGVGE